MYAHTPFFRALRRARLQKNFRHICHEFPPYSCGHHRAEAANQPQVLYNSASMYARLRLEFCCIRIQKSAIIVPVDTDVLTDPPFAIPPPLTSCGVEGMSMRW